MPVKKSTEAVGVRTPKSAPKAAPAAVKTNNSVSGKVKRNLKEENKINHAYVMPKNKGGIWTKVKQSNITVFDEKTGEVRELRYSRNENSVWADEQGEHIIREQIVFENKNLIIPFTNPPLQKYMALHPDNTANGGTRFSMVDEAKKAEIQMDHEFLALDAVSMVRDQTIEELLPVALYLGIDIDQKNIEIKRELLQEAKANPKRFIDMFDNPVVKVRSTIMSAIAWNLVKSDSDGLKWYDSNRLIVSTPAGQDTIDIATRFCLSERGALVLEELEKELSKI